MKKTIMFITAVFFSSVVNAQIHFGINLAGGFPIANASATEYIIIFNNNDGTIRAIGNTVPDFIVSSCSPPVASSSGNGAGLVAGSNVIFLHCN